MKDEIIEKINQAILTEDEGIPIYSKHIESTLFWSGLNDEFKQKIQDTLNIIKRESQNHKILLTHIKKIINERY